jgi:hypothetical protein
MLNVTAVVPGGSGHLTVWASGSTPLASSLNFSAGRTTPNLVIARLDTNPAFRLRANAPTDVLVDVVGYFSGDAAGRFVPVDPVRTLDTRVGNHRPVWRGALTSQEAYLVPGTLMFGVPGNAIALSYNTTVTGATGTGHLTVFPGGGSVPLASNLNFAPGQTVPNAVVVRPGGSCNLGYLTNGCIGMKNGSFGRVHVITDLAGYYVDTGT